MLKFFWNGVKGSDGKLQRVFYSVGRLLSAPEGTISIYARDLGRFSDEVRASFEVQNNSDSMSDYFESDFIRVRPLHPLYREVAGAYLVSAARSVAALERALADTTSEVARSNRLGEIAELRAEMASAEHWLTADRGQ